MTFTRTIEGHRITTVTDAPIYNPESSLAHKARLYLAWWTRRLARRIEPGDGWFS